ncbi:S-methyl-5'-thioadenosine phosphorylase [Streptomyces sp. NPDC046727]|uniref:S-methyl-5'-thioadenosine phosphorylase n=1 Tax=Streptomyces sp. NPDC046727 TaxID=3155373 RepID=UPI0033DBFDA7
MSSRETRAELGVIGGSGLYGLDGLEDVRETRVSTPYGEPSSAVVTGTLGGVGIAFLARHGRGHRLLPGEVPYRANVYALKSLGVRRILSVSAVGSLREDHAPGDIVIPDQIVDRTRGVRPATFFGDGLVAHVPFADPYCAALRPAVAAAVRGSSGAVVHERGTYCCVEGPRFSSRAESHLYRSWGLDVIGMTALPEASLAREAQLCYAGMALVTDYDCWREDTEESVTAEAVSDVMRRNSATAQAAVAELVKRLPAPGACGCANVLETSVLTHGGVAALAARADTAWLVDGAAGTRRETGDE